MVVSYPLRMAYSIYVSRQLLAPDPIYVHSLLFQLTFWCNLMTYRPFSKCILVVKSESSSPVQ